MILRGEGGQKKKAKRSFQKKEIIGSGSPNQLPNMEHGTPVGALVVRTLACKGEVRRHAASPRACAGCSMPSPSPLHKTTHVARTAQLRLRSWKDGMTSGPPHRGVTALSCRAQPHGEELCVAAAEHAEGTRVAILSTPSTLVTPRSRASCSKPVRGPSEQNPNLLPQHFGSAGRRSKLRRRAFLA